MATHAVMLAAAAVALLLPLQADAVQPKELEDWFASSEGLWMSRQDAELLAQKQWQTLTQCGTTVQSLQKLRNVMTNRVGMGLSMAQLRQEILPLAEQHVSPAKLGQMYVALSSHYTISGGLSLPNSEAQSRAIEMVKSRAEPDELYALYKVMYGWFGLGLDQKTAQQTAIALTLAGADAGEFKVAYQQAVARGASMSDAIDSARNWAVAQELKGLVRRYAGDAKPYAAHEFQQYYGNTWFGEWLAAPMELRVSSDHMAHTAFQFARQFGSQWVDKYQASAEATQRRLAQDGKSYTMQEFQAYYGDSWQDSWAASPEVPCSQCAPLAAANAAAPVMEAVAGFLAVREAHAETMV